MLRILPLRPWIKVLLAVDMLLLVVAIVLSLWLVAAVAVLNAILWLIINPTLRSGAERNKQNVERWGRAD